MCNYCLPPDVNVALVVTNNTVVPGVNVGLRDIRFPLVARDNANLELVVVGSDDVLLMLLDPVHSVHHALRDLVQNLVASPVGHVPVGVSLTIVQTF